MQQVELENWVNSIHSACAAAFARHRGKTGTLHLLQEEIYRLEKSIESVSQTRLLLLLLRHHTEQKEHCGQSDTRTLAAMSLLWDWKTVEQGKRNDVCDMSFVGSVADACNFGLIHFEPLGGRMSTECGGVNERMCPDTNFILVQQL